MVEPNVAQVLYNALKNVVVVVTREYALVDGRTGPSATTRRDGLKAMAKVFWGVSSFQLILKICCCLPCR